jgi:hypothetical protein
VEETVADQGPDQLAKKTFIYTMIGAAIYIGVVFAWILWR